MKKVIGILMLCLAMNGAQAHGAPSPNHGGIVQAVGETWLELVVKGDTLELYLEDDGEEMPSAGLTGKLTLVNGASKTDVVLKPAGGNKLEARGTTSKGGKVLALLTLADKKTHVSATFQLK